jgi:RNA polymerase sigma-70 factor (ECF subfamily)
MNDAQLLALLHNNPSEGLGILMDEYIGLVCVIVKNRLNSVCAKEDVEECISDVFVAFYEGINKFDLQQGTIKAYLCAIAKKKAINIYLAKLKVINNISIDDEFIQKSTSDDFLIEEEYLTKVNRRILMQAIKDLGEPDHEIIVRKYFFDESSKSISKRLGMTVTAIDSRTSRAIKKLRGRLESGLNGEKFA